MISVLLNLSRICLWSDMLSSLENVACVLEKNVYCILLLFSGVFYRCLLSLVGFYTAVHVYHFLADLPPIYLVLPITESGMLKSTVITIFYFSLQFCQFCFMYFEMLLVGTYIFIIVKSSWWIYSFTIIKCPFVLIHITTPPLFS